MRLRLGAMVALTAMGMSALVASTAMAVPTNTIACTGCHGGPNLPVTATLVSNSGATATYNVSAPGADYISVFNGAKVTQVTGSVGSITVATGNTYTIYSVAGPTESDGLGTTTVSPAAPPAPADTTAPVTTSNAVATYVSSAAIALSATDGGSGVAATFFRLDGAAQVAGASVSTSALGSHSLVFWSVDVAGNIEAAKTVTFNVTSPPVVTPPVVTPPVVTPPVVTPPATPAAKVRLSAPVAPKVMKRARLYTVHGSLSPRHARGSKPVWIYKYRKVGGKWKAAGFVKATVVDSKAGSRYAVKMKLTAKGKWRLRAFAPADAEHAATWSGAYDYVTVK